MSQWIFADVNQVVVDVLINTRRAAGLRQEDLASRLSKTQSLISRIESGQRGLDVIEFYAVARALEVDPLDLYSAIVAKLSAKIDI